MILPGIDIFSPAEICAIHLDGELFSQQMIDSADDWRSRSNSVLYRERWPMVLTGISALWAMGYHPEPLKHCASILPPRRIRQPQNESLNVEERSLLHDDFVLFQTHGVTTPARTLFDIVRLSAADWNTTTRVGARWMSQEHPTIMCEVFDRFNSDHKQPHRIIALSRLEELSQPS